MDLAGERGFGGRGLGRGLLSEGQRGRVSL